MAVPKLRTGLPLPLNGGTRDCPLREGSLGRDQHEKAMPPLPCPRSDPGPEICLLVFMGEGRQETGHTENLSVLFWAVGYHQ